jgi:omega-amidase
VKIFCCQPDIAWEDKSANHAKVRAMLEQAAPPRGSLVLLPEMFATGFSMNIAGISDEPGRETQQFLAGLARDMGIHLVGGIVTRAPDGRGRNEAVVLDPAGNEVTRYRKIHPFTFGGESKHYEAGARLRVFDWESAKVCPFVCYDLRFPEVFRAGMRGGAEAFAVIANWPSARHEHWVTLLKARAIENQAYVAAVNRCGSDPKLHYCGQSMIIDPRGRVLADAGEQERVIDAEVDLEDLLAWRREFPVLQDMRDGY